MMTSVDSQTEEQLIDYLTGDLPEAEVVALEERLEKDTDLQKHLMALATEEALLHRRAASETQAEPWRLHMDENSRAAFAPKPSFWIQWGMMAACVVAVASMFWGFYERSMRLQIRDGEAAGSSDISANNPKSKIEKSPFGHKMNPQLEKGLLGLVVTDAGAVFDEASSPEGVMLKPKSYALSEGAAHVRLVNGVDLVFRAPTRFSLNNAMHVKLEEGAMRATVPDNAEGFVITTPSADVEDLGTEFGVRVNPKTKASQILVFDGEVKIHKTQKQDQKAKSLLMGEKLTLDQTGQETDGIIDVTGFPTRNDVEYERWKLWQKTLLKDKALLHHFTFNLDPANPAQLTDVAGDAHGEIVGARWVKGRWPQKQALLFDDEGDTVKLTVEGEHMAVTIAAWVKAERFERSMSILLRTVEHPAGAMRFFFSRKNRVVNGYVADAMNRLPRKKGEQLKEISTGQWIHVAAVYDMENQLIQTYLNGRPHTQRELRQVLPIVIGEARLCLPVDPGTGWGPFRGRMDELMIWKRALVQREIRKIYNRSRTSF